MKCNECGRNLESGARFCHHCGAEVNSLCDDGYRDSRYDDGFRDVSYDSGDMYSDDGDKTVAVRPAPYRGEYYEPGPGDTREEVLNRPIEFDPAGGVIAGDYAKEHGIKSGSHPDYGYKKEPLKISMDKVDATKSASGEEKRESSDRPPLIIKTKPKSSSGGSSSKPNPYFSKPDDLL